MRSPEADHRGPILVCAVIAYMALVDQATASGSISASAGSITFVNTSGAGVRSTGNNTYAIGNSSSAPTSSTPASSLPGDSMSSINDTAPNLPFNLAGSSQSSGSGGGGSSGGGLVWGDPLSADIGDFGKVHTSLHYFSQSSYNGTQQAVGVNFSVKF